MPDEEKKQAGNIDIPSIKDLKKENYQKLNDAFALMSLIPISVFFYLLITRFFSIEIVIGDTGLVIFIALFLAFLGYLSGYSTVRGLMNKVIKYTDEAKAAYEKLNETQKYLIQAEKFHAISLVKSRVKFEHIEMIENMQEGLPPVFVDRNKIEQVFINLLLNAAQAMLEGGGRIFVRTYDKVLGQEKNGVGERKNDYFKSGERAIVLRGWFSPKEN